MNATTKTAAKSLARFRSNVIDAPLCGRTIRKKNQCNGKKN